MAYEKKSIRAIIEDVSSDNAKYLPEDVSYELSHFEEFMEKRQELMSGALKSI